MLGELFDPKADLVISSGIRPHWSQAGGVVFITFRTFDSIPKEVLVRWKQEKNEWMQRRGYPPDRCWSEILPTLSEEDKYTFHNQFNRHREDFLDTCHGRCLLKRPELAQIVGNSLLHFDGQRYRMGDFVVMPNHVHLLVTFASPEAIRKQCASWLHYTAFRINERIGEKGHFWQQEPFDHLVRSSDQYEYLRRYISNNPKKAKLKEGEYLYRRYQG